MKWPVSYAQFDSDKKEHWSGIDLIFNADFDLRECVVRINKHLYRAVNLNPEKSFEQSPLKLEAWCMCCEDD